MKVARIGGAVTQYRLGLDDVELWFDYPEPSYYQRFRTAFRRSASTREPTKFTSTPLCWTVAPRRPIPPTPRWWKNRFAVK
ncbi:MAG: hypothetical protein IPG97_18475 [Microthrixaceae bacterium]|nr:hypothetical protein [Microthrixaceae bacterium]